ncbi:MAG: protease inhibitor [Corynebacteriales bacterium]|nr:protease inhibitor [Mycobacteriales bacterium]
MYRRALAGSALLATLATLALAFTGPAQADDNDKKLALTVSRLGGMSGTSLECPADSRAHHPHAAQACEALDAAGGDFDQLQHQDSACVLLFDPITVTARGIYNQRVIQWQHTYGNECQMRAATGEMFVF